MERRYYIITIGVIGLIKFECKDSEEFLEQRRILTDDYEKDYDEKCTKKYVIAFIYL